LFLILRESGTLPDFLLFIIVVTANRLSRVYARDKSLTQPLIMHSQPKVERHRIPTRRYTVPVEWLRLIILCL